MGVRHRSAHRCRRAAVETSGEVIAPAQPTIRHRREPEKCYPVTDSRTAAITTSRGAESATRKAAFINS